MKTECCAKTNWIRLKENYLVNWNFCPFCGAERPKEVVRNLAEIIESQDFDEAPKRSNYKAMAKACIDAVEEVIDERIQTRAPNSDWTRSLQDIKKAIRETLL